MRVLIVVLGLCFTIPTFSQNYNFGKVSIEEVKEKTCSIDSTANAAYLYKYRKTYFEYEREQGFELKTEVHERIKIYNQEGLDYATKKMRLYQGSNGNREEVSTIKAYSYNLKDGKLIKLKLDKSGIFKTKANKYNNEVKFTMPDVKQGSVIEYKYEITSPFWSNVGEFIFQHDIPVKKLESIFEVPEYFSFKSNTKGYFMVKPAKESKRAKLLYKNEIPLSENAPMDPTIHYRTGEVEYKNEVFNYNLTDIGALKDEPYVNNINNYRSSVKYELSYTKFPNSTVEYYSTTWEDVVKTIYRSSNFGDELNKTSYFKKDIDNIVGSISDPQKRTALIFNYVKSHINWNGYYGYFVDEGVKKAYKEQTGNVADINLMLTAMLNYAGINAYPVLVSTRRNGVPLFPTREGYNYVVTYVKMPEMTFLLDATSKYSYPNLLPFRALNWQGRIIAEKGNSTLIDLYPNSISKDMVGMMVNLDENGTIKGKCRNTKTNHKALSFRRDFNRKGEDDFLDDLENKYGGMEISEFIVKNNADLAKPIIESFTFEKENQADIIGDKIYFSPLFYMRMSENPFKIENREFPVDFGYPYETKYRFTINLPDGYKVESLPKSEAFKMADDLGFFSYKISNDKEKVQVIVSSKINSSIIAPQYYEALKSYFSMIVKKETDQVVLTRI
ncbi:DUF3857 domain-containing protein [uncultured Algibacter sp.]|uniref:DUF3857 domain-containing protein n=1 Tax=uncultured Algibacter sp. TaxID=298659 RepID=UPI002620A654|nr:DUF3857 domain-containing protein [uncultured Algibacter sp.]